MRSTLRQVNHSGFWAGLPRPMLERRRGHSIPSIRFSNLSPASPLLAWLISGNRIYDTETDAFMSTVGAKGDKLFDGSWGYDVGFRYSQIKNTSTGSFVSATRFNQILNANDPIFDPRLANSSAQLSRSIHSPITVFRSLLTSPR